MWVSPQGHEDPLEKEMETHFSILAGKSLWTEELCGLQSVGSQRVRHNSVTERLALPLSWLIYTVVLVSGVQQSDSVLIYSFPL